MKQEEEEEEEEKEKKRILIYYLFHFNTSVNIPEMKENDGQKVELMSRCASASTPNQTQSTFEFM